MRPEPYWATDPLVVLPIAFAREARADLPRSEPFDWPLVPDPLAKAGPFTVRCGDDAPFDPPLHGDPKERTFLGYVRDAIAWGGLPGFAVIADPPAEFLRALRS